jgi:hypothetical protein
MELQWQITASTGECGAASNANRAVRRNQGTMEEISNGRLRSR